MPVAEVRAMGGLSAACCLLVLLLLTDALWAFGENSFETHKLLL